MKPINAHSMHHPLHRPKRCDVRGQRGAILIVSLILLVVLTLLGVSVMNMTQLEEKMASNAQEVEQSFQSAETGLEMAYNTPAAWRNLFGVTTGVNLSIPSAVGRQDVVSFSVQAIASEVAPAGYDSNSKKFHFDFGSTGKTSSGMSTTELHGGGYRIAPNAGGYLD